MISPVQWAQEHPFWYTVLFLLLMAGIVVTYRFYRLYRHDETKERLYNLLGQLSFILNYLFLPVLSFMGLAALLGAASPRAALALTGSLASMDPTLPSVILIVVFATVLVQVWSLPAARGPDEGPPHAGLEQTIVLSACHLAFYYANLVVVSSYAGNPDVYHKTLLLIASLDTIILCLFAYVHYRFSELRRINYIHGW